jgi:hypothetical protein
MKDVRRVEELGTNTEHDPLIPLGFGLRRTECKLLPKAL